MPRKRNLYPKPYPHPNGRDRVRIHQDGEPRDVWLGPTGSAEACDAYARLLAVLAANNGRLPEGGLTPPDRPDVVTVSIVVARWIEDVLPTLSAAGKEQGQYRRCLMVLQRTFGPTPAAEFDADRLETVRNVMASGSWVTEEDRRRIREHKPGQGVAPLNVTERWARRTVNRHVVRIRSVWRWAERKKLVPGGSYEHLRTVKSFSESDPRVRQTKRRRACSEDEARAVSAACPKTVGDMLWLQWLTGMRSQEVRLMRPEAIDRSGDVWLYRPRDKTAYLDDGYERVVPLNAECRQLLEPHLAKCRKPGEYVFKPRRHATTPCYTCSAYARIVKRAANRAGVADFVPYRTRHGAKRRITRTHGLDAARAMLGQRSLGVANQYDAELDVETAVKVAREEARPKTKDAG